MRTKNKRQKKYSSSIYYIYISECLSVCLFVCLSVFDSRLYCWSWSH